MLVARFNDKRALKTSRGTASAPSSRAWFVCADRRVKPATLSWQHTAFATRFGGAPHKPSTASPLLRLCCASLADGTSWTLVRAASLGAVLDSRAPRTRLRLYRTTLRAARRGYHSRVNALPLGTRVRRRWFEPHRQNRQRLLVLMRRRAAACVVGTTGLARAVCSFPDCTFAPYNARSCPNSSALVCRAGKTCAPCRIAAASAPFITRAAALLDGLTAGLLQQNSVL